MDQYKLYGGGGSPYSRKMRAIMLYRRIPHIWVQVTPEVRKNIKHDGPPVIPVLQLPEDGSLHVDSTPLALSLEERHSGRSIIPDDSTMAFLNHLIEDMADEWVTKMMFHYRWFLEIDQAYSSRQIISDNTPGLRGEALDKAAKMIRDRQVSRMPMVGCTEQNAPVIEESYIALSDILDSFVTRDEYLFGTRPSLADFALYGQLRTLSADHTPMLIMRDRVPSVYDWIHRLDDSSGIEGDWHGFNQMRPEVIQLLEFASKYYLPFMQANYSALMNGEETIEVELAGKPFSQAPFKYQAKCYDRLKKLLTRRTEPHLRQLLGETGCLVFLE
jgi:glutathione S-transferase